MTEALIKSKERVKALGEVFTAEREVNAMLDLLPENVFSNPLATFLEPACGTGNFLVKIVERKLSHGDGSLLYAAKCASSVYAVDIAPDNVIEARARVLAVLLAGIREPLCDGQLEVLTQILAANFVVGNTLEGLGQLGLMQWDWSTGLAIGRPANLHTN